MLNMEERRREGKEEEDIEDRRREAAIASIPSLQPNSKPKKGISIDQLSKFQELHRKRLQIKSKSKLTKKSKDGQVKKSHRKYINTEEKVEEESNLSISSSQNHGMSSSLQLDDTESATPLLSNKPRKLHWGLDAKERWERKANM